MSDETRTVVRSPSYPSMSLAEAVEAVRPIEKYYRNNAVDREVAAKLIGFTSLSGPANKALAALSSYGLVERAGKGEMRVTDRAQAILHSVNPYEVREALVAAATAPILFCQLWDKFSGILVPPEDGVVSYLRRQNFNESAIKPATKAFLGTAQYLQQNDVTESYGSQPSGESESTSRPHESKPEVGSMSDVQSANQRRPESDYTPVAETYEPSAARRVYSEEYGPQHYAEVRVAGEIDESVVSGLEQYVKRLRQRVSLGGNPDSEN